MGDPAGIGPEIVLAALAGVGLLGAFDDYLNARTGEGISVRQKLLWQVVFAFFAAYQIQNTYQIDALAVPFIGKVAIMPEAYVLLAAFAIIAASNAVNLTDGLDGLAIVPVMIAAATFALIAYLAGNVVFTTLLVEWAHLPSIAANACAVGLTSVANFALADRWVFQPRVVAAVAVAERARFALDTPIVHDGREVVISCSIGVATSTVSNDPEALILDADRAAYEAKRGGRARVQVFDRAMHARLLDDLTVESEFRRAIAGGELEVHFQPIVDTQIGRAHV